MATLLLKALLFERLPIQHKAKLEFFKHLNSKERFVYLVKLIFNINFVLCHKNRSYTIRTNRFDEFIINEILFSNIYKLSKFTINEKPTIIDIGANIGVFSINATERLKDFKILAYEPCPSNFKLLKENIKLNNFERKIFPFKKGVFSSRGSQRLFLDNKNSGGHSLYGNHSQKYIEIECITLEDIFKENDINFCDILKLDCEGSEYEILFSLDKSYLKKIKNIIMEYHPGPTYKLKKYLEKNNFKVQDKDGILYAKNTVFKHISIY